MTIQKSGFFILLLVKLFLCLPFNKIAMCSLLNADLSVHPDLSREGFPILLPTDVSNHQQQLGTEIFRPKRKN